MNKLVKFSIIVTIILSLFQIIVSNVVSTTGLELGKLDDKIKLYKKTNEVLKEEYLIVASYTNISQNATTIGFIESKSQISLNNLPIAFNQ